MSATAPSSRTALIVCAIVLGLFYLIATLGYENESATIDEPMQAVGAYWHVFDHDFRINPEDPPLWNYLTMLPHRAASLHSDVPPEVYERQIKNIQFEFLITARLLYQTPGLDAAAFINRSRAALLIAGVALGGMIGWWAFRLAGSAAAMVAVCLFALDPNFLAHAPLIKNDVCLSFIMLAAAWATWRVGRKITFTSVISLLLITAAGPVVKFSGVLVVLIVGVLLLVRAVRSTPWEIGTRSLSTRRSRLLAGLILCSALSIACFVMIWACYGFRFDPTPEPGKLLNSEHELVALRQNFAWLKTHQYPTEAEAAQLPLPLAGRLEQFAEAHHLLPQAWLFGMLFTYHSTLLRESYCLGQYYVDGRWYYFPCVMLFKTPCATVAAIGAASLSLLIWRRRESAGTGHRWVPGWDQLCVAVPLAIYAVSALTTHLNLGLRHILPIYPFIFLLLAMRWARLRAARPRLAVWLATLTIAGVGAETALAFPHYISFFNAPSRPYRLSLLSDSNFDWGQDLPYVAEWQRRHPSVPLYLGYWCAADPEFYGIRYINIPGGYVLQGDYVWPPPVPGVIAISATLLQGVDCPASLREKYAPLRKAQPREILGDSIYLYDWPLQR